MSKLSPINAIPEEFMKGFIASEKGERTFDRDKGEWIEGIPIDVNFKGAILPLTTKDLNQFKITQEGVYSVDDKKLYTDKLFLNHTIVKDGTSIYKIYVVKEYDIINPNFKLYYIKKVDKIDG